MKEVFLLLFCSLIAILYSFDKPKTGIKIWPIVNFVWVVLLTSTAIFYYKGLSPVMVNNKLIIVEVVFHCLLLLDLIMSKLIKNADA